MSMFSSSLQPWKYEINVIKCEPCFDATDRFLEQPIIVQLLLISPSAALRVSALEFTGTIQNQNDIFNALVELSNHKQAPAWDFLSSAIKAFCKEIKNFNTNFKAEKFFDDLKNVFEPSLTVTSICLSS